MAADETEKQPAKHENPVTSVPETLLQHSHDADEALKAFIGHEGEVFEIDEATNRRLLRIIDWNLIPIMCVVYCLNFLDKTTVSYASITGLKTDIHLKGDNYQWLGSLFYFGYLAWEYPTNMLLQRLPLAKYSAFCIIMWGVTLSCFAAVQNFSGAVAIRFLLGVFEAAVTPGFALFTSQWYTQKEQVSRIGIWYSFNGFAQIFGAVLAYGIAKGVEKHGAALATWRIIFLVTGLLTVAIGVIFLFTMPDSQLNARFLNQDDRVLAVERVRVNRQGIGNRHFKFYQLREAIADPLTWALFFFSLVGDIPNGGITNFFSQLIVSFGYSDLEALLYGAPAGAVEAVALIFGGWLAGRYGHRLAVGGVSLLVAILGICLMVFLPHSLKHGRLAGYYLMQTSAMCGVALLSLISSNVAGYTKKTTVAAIYLIGYCVGNLIGPQTFRPKDAPDYRPAQITILVCNVACIVDLVFITWWLQRQNKKKATQRAQPSYIRLENQEFLDLTDGENPEFVYVF